MSSADQLGGKPVVGDEYPVIPITAGIPRCQRALLHPVEFNDLAAVDSVARRYKVAALITEPVLQNIGVVPPQPGYLQGLRELADTYGFLLIFDEVKTGFRAGVGGYQQLCEVRPDLSTFGKAMANGYPIAALAGKLQYMALAVSDDIAKRVFIAGTYNCHPLPVAAAISCIRKLKDPILRVYERLEELARRLEVGQRDLIAKHGIRAVIARQGIAHCAYFMDRVPRNWWEVLTQHNSDFDLRYRRALIERGIYQFPVAAKQGSISFAHTESDIDLTLDITESVLSELCK
jgi:glutamate-1-semialdehyde 2,1-aminomutase